MAGRRGRSAEMRTRPGRRQVVQYRAKVPGAQDQWSALVRWKERIRSEDPDFPVLEASVFPGISALGLSMQSRFHRIHCADLPLTDAQHMLTMQKRDLAAILLVACLSGCVSVSGEPDQGGPLKKAVDVTAVTAVEFMSDSKDSTISNAWQDAGGTWHWTKTEQGVGTFECEGSRVGVPKQCDKIGGP